MIKTMLGYEINCDKCFKFIRDIDECHMLTDQAFYKHSHKKHFCGNCIRKRIKNYCIDNKIFDERYVH